MRFDDDHVDDFGLGLTELERLLSRRRARRTYGDDVDVPNSYRRGNTFPRDDYEDDYDDEPRERYEPSRSRQPAKQVTFHSMRLFLKELMQIDQH